MKKLLAVLAFLAVCVTFVNAAPPENTNSELVLVPTIKSKTSQQNRAWIGTFQMVWNDFQNNIVNGPITFVGDEKNQTVKELNRQRFKAAMISPNSYYKTYGLITPELKTEIETALKLKFNETSDILDMFDWTPAPNKYLVYTMLKKDFKFMQVFDELEPARFGKFKGKVKYFGINEDSDPELDDTVGVLYFNSREDFAVSIKTNTNDIMYIYRTDDDKTFDKLYSDMNMKAAAYLGWHEFQPKDELRIPDINLYKLQRYTDLENKEIKNADMYIASAVQTAQFRMNRKGVSLKSEAAIATMMSAMPMPKAEPKPRKFYADDTFVLFLQEKGKKLPYFALRVYDVNLINSTGKPIPPEEENDIKTNENVDSSDAE